MKLVSVIWMDCHFVSLWLWLFIIWQKKIWTKDSCFFFSCENIFYIKSFTTLLFVINIQVWPWSTKWSRAKGNRVLPRECTGHSKGLLPTIQEKTLHMRITIWSILKSDWLYSLQQKMEKLYTVSKNKTGSWLWLRSWTPYCQIQT